MTGVKVQCPNSMYRTIVSSSLPVTSCKPGEPCGCSLSLTVPATDLPSSYEPLLWGTSAWSARYFRRNLVESYNSVEEYHCSIDKHSIRVRGDKWELVHLFLVLNVWYRLLRSWLYREGAHALDPDDYPHGAPNHPEVIAAVIARLVEAPAARPVRARAAPD